MGVHKSIGLEIKMLSNMIKRSIDDGRTDEEREAINEITGVQGWIIGYTLEKSKTQDVFQRDIEKAFNIRRSTATGILQLMEKKGYIQREQVVHDARLKKLTLTPKAIELHHVIMKRITEVEDKLKSGLSEGEIMFFFEIMEKIRKNIES